MRLIDADKVTEREKYYAEKYKGDFGEIAAVEMIKILDSAPTVDAIPIEWIKNRIDHINEIIDECGGMLIAYNEIDKGMLNELWVLENMLTIWKEEKKNEIKYP